jgi:predicted HicB family RNase H-like nuclease
MRVAMKPEKGVQDARPSKVVNVKLHPEIHKELKISAIQEDISMEERLHSILCLEFERADLLTHDPETASAR